MGAGVAWEQGDPLGSDPLPAPVSYSPVAYPCRFASVASIFSGTWPLTDAGKDGSSLKSTCARLPANFSPSCSPVSICPSVLGASGSHALRPFPLPRLFSVCLEGGPSPLRMSPEAEAQAP